MSDLPQREPREASAGEAMAGLVVWTAGQLVVLAAVWADMRISAGHSAGEIGLQIVVSSQIVLGAALCGSIASMRSATVAFAVAFPITQLAGWRCGAAGVESLLGSMATLLWLAGLACWMRVARSEWARVALTAALLLWVTGLPLLAYLTAEFSPASSLPHGASYVCPLMAMPNRGAFIMLLTGHAALAGMCAWVAGRQRVRPAPRV